MLEVRREGRLDELTVVVEGAVDLPPTAAEAARAALAHEIKAYVGVSAAVKVVPVGTVERSMGKAKRIIDLRPKS